MEGVKVYKSKTDYWLVGLMIALGILVFGMNIAVGVPWVFTLILGVFYFGVVLAALFLVRYEISDGTLTVKSAGIPHQRCEVKNIKSVRKTRTIESAPSSSLDRIELRMADGSRLVISPKDKRGFVEELQKINPDIEIGKL